MTESIVIVSLGGGHGTIVLIHNVYVSILITLDKLPIKVDITDEIWDTIDEIIITDVSDATFDGNWNGEIKKGLLLFEKKEFDWYKFNLFLYIDESLVCTLIDISINILFLYIKEIFLRR